MPELAIKLNENPMSNDCPLCGDTVNANIGADLFLADTDEIVCIRCGMKHAPILACLITFADFSRAFEMNNQPQLSELLCFAELSELFKQAETKFGDKWQDSQEFIKSPMNACQDFGFQG